LAYKYDIFFSYKHDYSGKPWVIDVFLKTLTKSLEKELNRKVNVFLDVDEFDIAETDTKKLTKDIGIGLGYSRCMIAAWSKQYFASKWCWCECQSFVKRINEESNWSPLFPVVMFNGEHFPKVARVESWLDLREYFGFRMQHNNELMLKFQNKVSKAALQLCKTIQSSPEWSEAWILEEWFNSEPPFDGLEVLPSFQI